MLNTDIWQSRMGSAHSVHNARQNATGVAKYSIFEHYLRELPPFLIHTTGYCSISTAVQAVEKNGRIVHFKL
jgi:hypothetical protein